MGNKNLDEVIDDTVDIINETHKTYKKAKNIIGYWSPNNAEQRRFDKEIKEQIARKENIMAQNFKILYVFMIISTIVAWIIFNKIGIWLNINSRFLLGLTVIILETVICTLFGTILFIWRK